MISRTDPDDAGHNEWLAIRCQLGERDAFDALVTRWHRPLASYLRGLIQPDGAVDECLQESWLRIVRGMPQLADPARVVPWMFSIARRTAFDQLRLRYRPDADSAVDPASLVDHEDRAVGIDELDQLHEGLATLAPIDRDVLVLFHLDELSLAEVAQVLDVPIGTVKSRLHRARQTLREHLIAHGLTGVDTP